MADTNSANLDFEKSIVELETRINKLKNSDRAEKPSVAADIAKAQKRLEKQLTQVYGNLSAWQKTAVARHPLRPHCSDYIKALIEDWVQLNGDRTFAEDAAIVAGIGKFKGKAVAVIGQEKGSSLETRLQHNFGMAKPEGYRKAQRIMDLADKFNLPLITFVDTAGAYPGVDAEERGQAEAIAKSIEKSLQLKVPVVTVIIGEGGSGGALALATSNKIAMLEHSIYSVISPEGCASILWKDENKAAEASEALRLTAQDLKTLKVIDNIIEEPLGGAHRSPNTAIERVGRWLESELKALEKFSGEEIKTMRAEKFYQIGRNLAE